MQVQHREVTLVDLDVGARRARRRGVARRVGAVREGTTPSPAGQLVERHRREGTPVGIDARHDAPAATGGAPTFPRARYFIHEKEWHDALSGDELLYKSYPPPVVAALRALPADRITLLCDVQDEVAPGLRLSRSSGHTDAP